MVATDFSSRSCPFRTTLLDTFQRQRFHPLPSASRGRLLRVPPAFMYDGERLTDCPCDTDLSVKQCPTRHHGTDLRGTTESADQLDHCLRHIQGQEVAAILHNGHRRSRNRSLVRSTLFGARPIVLAVD